MQKRRDNLSVSLFPVKGPSLACNSAPKRENIIWKWLQRERERKFYNLS